MIEVRLRTAGLAYLAVTALLFRELLPKLTTHLYSDLGDPLLTTAILAWNAKHVPLTDAWWNFPSFVPLSGVTAFTEHLLLAYPVTSPIVWVTGNPIVAYNVVYLLAVPLNGVAAFALARELTRSSPAAFVAGLAYAFAPYQAVHLSHIQLMWSFGMPLALLWLHRYLSTGSRRALMWFAAGWFVTALANAYLLILFPILAALWCGWFVRAGEWRRVGVLVMVAVAALAPLVPLLWGYHARLSAYGLSRSFDDVRSMSADMVGLVGMYHHATAWRWLLPHHLGEGALFPGFTIVALGAIALIGAGTTRVASQSPAHVRKTVSWPTRVFVTSGILTIIVLLRVWMGPWGWHIGPVPLPPFNPASLFTIALGLALAGAASTRAFRTAWARRDASVFFGVAIVVLWLVSLGPVPEWSTPWQGLTAGPYRLLMQFPGADVIRVPARAWLPAVLCLAMLAGYGTLAITRQRRQIGAVMVLALAPLIVAEGWFAAPVVEVPRPMREGVIPEGAVVLDLPVEEGYANAIPQYRAVLRGYRTLNGYSGYEPPHFSALRHAVADLNPKGLEPYRSDSDLYVIIRPGVGVVTRHWVRALPGASHVFDVNDAEIYRLARLHARRE